MRFQLCKNENEVSVFQHQIVSNFWLLDLWKRKKKKGEKKTTDANAIQLKPKKYTYPVDKQIQLLFLDGGN